MRPGILLSLYPATWRRRYGEELEDLLETRPLTVSLALDLARGAFDARLHPELLQPALFPAGGIRMNFSTLKQPSALIPLAISLASLSLVLGHAAFFQYADQANVMLHLSQLLMAGQLLLIAFFAVRWLPRDREQALLVVVLQFVVWLTAAVPVFLLKF
jgi:hypothetical protein